MTDNMESEGPGLTTMLLSPISMILQLLESYGWYLLFFTVVAIYIYFTRIRKYVIEFQQKREQREYDAKYHKDPDIVSERLLTQQNLVQKLQNEYNEDAKRFLEKQREMEEKRRTERLEKNMSTTKPGQKLGNQRLAC